MIKNKYVALVAFVVCFLAFWNVAQWLWATLVTKTVFAPALGYDVIRPAVVAVIVGYVLIILPTKNKKK